MTAPDRKTLAAAVAAALREHNPIGGWLGEDVIPTFARRIADALLSGPLAQPPAPAGDGGMPEEVRDRLIELADNYASVIGDDHIVGGFAEGPVLLLGDLRAIRAALASTPPLSRLSSDAEVLQGVVDAAQRAVWQDDPKRRPDAEPFPASPRGDEPYAWWEVVCCVNIAVGQAWASAAAGLSAHSTLGGPEGEAVERVRDSLPAHYFDCARLDPPSNSGATKRCDCAADADLRSLLAAVERLAAEVSQRDAKIVRQKAALRQMLDGDDRASRQVAHLHARLAEAREQAYSNLDLAFRAAFAPEEGAETQERWGVEFDFLAGEDKGIERTVRWCDDRVGAEALRSDRFYSGRSPVLVREERSVGPWKSATPRPAAGAAGRG